MSQFQDADGLVLDHEGIGHYNAHQYINTPLKFFICSKVDIWRAWYWINSFPHTLYAWNSIGLILSYVSEILPLFLPLLHWWTFHVTRWKIFDRKAYCPCFGIHGCITIECLMAKSIVCGVRHPKLWNVLPSPWNRYIFKPDGHHWEY